MVATIPLWERVVHKISLMKKKGKNAFARRSNLTGVVRLKEINGRVDTNGDKEEQTKVCEMIMRGRKWR